MNMRTQMRSDLDDMKLTKLVENGAKSAENLNEKAYQLENSIIY